MVTNLIGMKWTPTLNYLIYWRSLYYARNWATDSKNFVKNLIFELHSHEIYLLKVGFLVLGGGHLYGRLELSPVSTH